MSPTLQVIHTLAALAWADGQIGDEEAATLHRFIASFSLSDADRSTAANWLAAPVELDTTGIAELPEGRKLAMYQVAARMAVADDEVGESERATLERLREALGLGVDVAAEIESELPRHD
ncbi:DUF533 domain-containing protein [Nannocystaceae bacterium ST9]